MRVVPVKDFVGANLHQSRPLCQTSQRQILWPQPIGLIRQFRVAGTAIHIGIGGAVNDQLGRCLGEHILHSRPLGNIHFGQIHGR